MWMNTEWDSTGSNWITKNTGRKGDYVDLLAIIDTLATPNVCGSGDTGITSNFSFKPIRIQVYDASNETLELVERTLRGPVRTRVEPRVVPRGWGLEPPPVPQHRAEQRPRRSHRLRFRSQLGESG